jgi:protein-S-isoprenylcysteine O-methyltransferase Ste14
MVAVALLMWLAHWLLGASVAPRALLYCGIGLCLAGFALAFTGLRTLVGRRTTPSPTQIERAKVLVTSGLYRFTRNPMYLGMVIFLIGIAAIFAEAWQLVGPLLFATYIQRFQIAPEERVMLDKFGTDYAAYKARVRRWI